MTNFSPSISSGQNQFPNSPKQPAIEKKQALSFGETFSLMTSRGDTPTPRFAQILLNYGRKEVIHIKTSNQKEETTDSKNIFLRLVQKIEAIVFKIFLLIKKGIFSEKKIDMPPPAKSTSAEKTSMWNSCFEIPKQVSAKLLYHVLGDAIGALDKDVTGFNQVNALQEWIEMFEQASVSVDPQDTYKDQISSCKKKIISGLTYCKKLTGIEPLENIKIALKQEMTALLPGESIIIPGGWTGSPGHAMIYEFVKGTDETNHQLRVHNAGSGCDYHDQILIEGKMKVCPYTIQGISIDKLCSTPSLACLRELSTYHPGKPWSAKDIYETWLPTLGGTKIPSSPYINIQQSGTCSFASVFSFLQTKLPEEHYVRIRIAFGIQTLTHFDMETEQDVLLATKCYRTLSQQLIEAEKNEILSFEELKTIRQKLTSTETKICTKKKHLMSSLISNNKPSSKKDLTCAIQASSESFQAFPIPTYLSSKPETTSTSFSPFIPEGNFDTQKDCLDYLQAIQNLVQQNVSNGFYEDTQHIIEIASKKLLKALQSHETWPPLSEKECEPIMKELHLLTKCYVENVVRIAQKTETPITLRPGMFTVLFSLIECSKIVGKDVPEIALYPTENEWIKKILSNERSDFSFGNQSAFFEEFQEEKTLLSLLKIPPTIFHPRWPYCAPNIATTQSIPAGSPSRKEDLSLTFASQLKKKADYVPEHVNKCTEEFLPLLLLVDGFRGQDEKETMKNHPPLSSSWRSLRQMVDCVGVLATFSDSLPKPGPVDLSVQWTCDTSKAETNYYSGKILGPVIHKKTLGLPEGIPQSGSSTPLRPHAKIDGHPVNQLHLQEYKEGMHPEAWKQELLITTKDMWGIDTALATFASYPDLLLDPQKQVLLEQYLFGCDALEKAKTDPFFQPTLTSIASFITQQMQLSEGDINHQVYCLRLARLALERGVGEPLSNKKVFFLFAKVQETINKDPSLVHQRYLFHAERARFFHTHKEILSAQEYDDLIVSAAYAVHSKEDSYKAYEDKKLLCEVLDERKVRDRLKQDPSSIINQIVHSKGSWTISEYPRFISTNPPREFDMATGRLIEQSLSSIPTPSFLYEEPHIKKALTTNPPHEVLQTAAGVYLFNIEKEGKTTSFRVFEEKHVVQKKIDGKFYQYVPNNQLPEKIIPQYLKETGSFWWNDDTKSFFIEMPDSSLYEAVPSGETTTIFICDTVSRKRTEERLLPENTLPPYLRSFEESGYIFASTIDGKTISRLSFPRIGDPPLSFSFDTKKQVFRREGFPQEILSPDQSSTLLDGPHKLILRNETTEESYFLIPGHFLEHIPETSLSFTTSRTPKNMPVNNPSRQHIPLYMCKKEKGNFVPESSEARAQLAYILLTQQDYEKASHVLGNMEKVPLSQDTIRILLWITQTQDTDVRALALRLKAEALLKRQEILFNEKIPQHEKPPISDFFAARHGAGIVQLTQDEELLLGISEKGTFTEKVHKEFTHVQPISINEHEAYAIDTESQYVSPLHPVLKEDFWYLFNATLQKQDSWKISNWSNNLFGCNSKDITLLEIAARTEHSPGQAAAAIILAMKQQPDKFKDIIVSKENRGQVWKQLIKLSNEVLTIIAPKPTEKQSTERVSLPQIAPQIPSQKQKIPTISFTADPGKADLTNIKNNLFVKTEQKKGIFNRAEALQITSLLRHLSPLHSTECDRFDTMVQNYVSEEIHPCKLTKEALPQAIKDIETKQKEVIKNAKEKKQTLVALLSTPGDDEELHIQQESLSAAGFVDHPRIQDAFNALLKPFPDGFFSINPSLSFSDAVKLRDTTVAYLAEKTYVQHLERIRTELQRLHEAPSITQEEEQSLFSLMSMTRNYDVTTAPQNLVLEESLSYFLRKDQTKIVDSFMNGSVDNKIMELIMGSGKSSAILPLLCQCISARKKLPILVIPESLFPSMAPQMAQTLQKSFSQHVFSWKIAENSPLSFEQLTLIESGIRTTLRDGGAVLIRPKDLSGLFLQFLSAIEEVPLDNTKIDLYQKIFTLLKKDGEALFDEADSTFDVLKEHLLSTSSMKPPSREVLDATAILYQTLAESTFNPKTKEEYEQKKQELIELLLKKDPSHSNEKRTYLTTGSLASIATLSSETQKKLRILYDEIHTFLPETYTKTCGIHYGRAEDPSAWYAVPYERGEPVPSSRFGNDLEEINYTYQYFFSLSKDKLQPYVASWIASVEAQIQQTLKEDPLFPIEALPEVLSIKNMFGQDIASLFGKSGPEAITEAILNQFESSPSRKIQFIKDIVLTKLKRPSSYIRSTTQLYSLLFSSLRGVTGTVWNQDTYPASLITEGSPESIGKTMHILSEQLEEHVPCFTDIEKEKGIIDVGGILQGKSGRTIAESLLKASDPSVTQGVIFYDKKNPYVLERNKEPYPLSKCTIKKEKLLAFWEQQFTTGSDLALGRTAESVVLIGKHTILRDLLQGVWRMRGLGKGQKVHFSVDTETDGIIRNELHLQPKEPLTIRHIVSFTLKNQINRLERDNLRAFQHKEEAILQEVAIASLLSMTGEELKRCLTDYKDLFFQEKEESFGEKEEVAIETEIARMEEKVSTHAHTTLEMKQKAKDLSKSMKSCLPKKVLQAPLGSLVQIQQQTQTSTQTQTQTQTQVHALRTINIPLFNSSICRFSRFFQNLAQGAEEKIATDTDLDQPLTGTQGKLFAMGAVYAPCARLEALFEAYDSSKQFAQTISPKIYASTAVYPSDQQIQSSNLTMFHPCVSNLPPLGYMVCIQKGTDTASRKYILLGQDDAEDFLQTRALGKEEYKATLINIHSGTMFFHEGSEQFTNQLSLDQDALCVRVQAKILGGNFHLSPEEQLGFIDWCLSQVGWNEMHTFIQAYVLAVRPEAARSFGSLDGIITDKGFSLIENRLKGLLKYEETSKEAKQLLDNLQHTKQVTKDMVHAIQLLRALTLGRLPKS